MIIIDVGDKMTNTNLMYDLEVAQSKVGRKVAAKQDTWEADKKWHPWMLVKNHEYQVGRVAVSCEKVYLCLEKDSLGNPVAVPIEYFEV